MNDSGEIGLWVLDIHDSLLLEPSWRELKNLISIEIKEYIENEINIFPHIRQILFTIVGQIFSEKYFPNIPYEPHLMEEPYMSNESKRLLLLEYNNKIELFMNEKINNLSNIYPNISNDILNVIESNYISYIERFEYEQNKKKKEYLIHLENEEEKENDINNVLEKVFETNINNNNKLKFNEEKISNILSEALIRLWQSKATHKYTDINNLHPTTSFVNDDIYNISLNKTKNISLKSFYSLSSENINDLPRNLLNNYLGHSLPTSLNEYLWKHYLHTNLKEDDLQQQITILAAAKNIDDPSLTNIDTMINITVRERLKLSLPLINDEEKNILSHKLKSLLNQFFVLTGRHSIRHFSVVLPLLLLYPNIPYKTGPILSMANELLNSYFPSESSRKEFNMRSAAALSWQIVQKESPRLTNHLESFYDATSLVGSSPLFFQDMMSEAFVGYLTIESIYFIWDTCFLLGWKEHLPLFLADIIILAGNELMQLDNAEELNDTLSIITQLIYTNEIREKFKQRYFR